jgi:hypothetical protein
MIFAQHPLWHGEQHHASPLPCTPTSRVAPMLLGTIFKLEKLEQRLKSVKISHGFALM